MSARDSDASPEVVRREAVDLNKSLPQIRTDEFIGRKGAANSTVWQFGKNLSAYSYAAGYSTIGRPSTGAALLDNGANTSDLAKGEREKKQYPTNSTLIGAKYARHITDVSLPPSPSPIPPIQQRNHQGASSRRNTSGIHPTFHNHGSIPASVTRHAATTTGVTATHTATSTATHTAYATNATNGAYTGVNGTSGDFTDTTEDMVTYEEDMSVGRKHRVPTPSDRATRTHNIKPIERMEQLLEECLETANELSLNISVHDKSVCNVITQSPAVTAAVVSPSKRKVPVAFSTPLQKEGTWYPPSMDIQGTLSDLVRGETSNSIGLGNHSTRFTNSMFDEMGSSMSIQEKPPNLTKTQIVPLDLSQLHSHPLELGISSNEGEEGRPSDLRLGDKCADIAWDGNRVTEGMNDVPHPHQQVDRDIGNVSQLHQRVDTDIVNAPQLLQQVDTGRGIAPQPHQQVDADIGNAPQLLQQLDTDGGNAPQLHQRVDTGGGNVPQLHQQVDTDIGNVPQLHQQVDTGEGNVPQLHQQVDADIVNVPQLHQQVDTDMVNVPQPHQQVDTDIVNGHRTPIEAESMENPSPHIHSGGDVLEKTQHRPTSVRIIRKKKIRYSLSKSPNQITSAGDDGSHSTNPTSTMNCPAVSTLTTTPYLTTAADGDRYCESRKRFSAPISLLITEHHTVPVTNVSLRLCKKGRGFTAQSPLFIPKPASSQQELSEPNLLESISVASLSRGIPAASLSRGMSAATPNKGISAASLSRSISAASPSRSISAASPSRSLSASCSEATYEKSRSAASHKKRKTSPSRRRTGFPNDSRPVHAHKIRTSMFIRSTRDSDPEHSPDVHGDETCSDCSSESVENEAQPHAVHIEYLPYIQKQVEELHACPGYMKLLNIERTDKLKSIPWDTLMCKYTTSF